MRAVVERENLRPASTPRSIHVFRASLYKPLIAVLVQGPREDDRIIPTLVCRVVKEMVTYDYRRVWAMFRHQQGVFVNQNGFLRMTRVEGLLREVHHPRPRLPANGSQAESPPNERRFAYTTCLDTADLGLVGLTALENACTREVLAWSPLHPYGTVEVFQAPDGAILSWFPVTDRFDGANLRTDRCSQYTSNYFQAKAKRLRIHMEVYRKSRPKNRGIIQRFNVQWKVDCLWTGGPTILMQTWAPSGTCIADYNAGRPHSSLDHLKPHR